MKAPETPGRISAGTASAPLRKTKKGVCGVLAGAIPINRKAATAADAAALKFKTDQWFTRLATTKMEATINPKKSAKMYSGCCSNAQWRKRAMPITASPIPRPIDSTNPHGRTWKAARH